jgi:hypothetical protein
MKRVAILLMLSVIFLFTPGFTCSKVKTVIVEEDNTVRKITDERPIKNDALIIDTGKVEHREDTLIGKYIIGPALYKKLIKAGLDKPDTK